MKARAVVTITRQTLYEFDVEHANDRGWAQAHEAALLKSEREHSGATITVSDIKLIKGPLVASVQWSGHHVRDVILARASFGHCISVEECDGIQARLETLGLEVVDRWNEGSGIVSFRAKGRDGEKLFTGAEQKFLCGETRVEDSR